jgi:hypothetical protein
VHVTAATAALTGRAARGRVYGRERRQTQLAGRGAARSELLAGEDTLFNYFNILSSIAADPFAPHYDFIEPDVDLPRFGSSSQLSETVQRRWRPQLAE